LRFPIRLVGRALRQSARQAAVGPGLAGSRSGRLDVRRTFATNGPWLELNVDGSEPGDTVALDRAASVSVVARVVGLGVQILEIVGPDGTLAATVLAAESEDAILTVTLEVTEPMWVAAIARGRGHPTVLGPRVYARTSPIWIEVAGASVARPADATWCLDWLHRFETLVRNEGNFPEPGNSTTS
jgi:hypothetical protein